MMRVKNGMDYFNHNPEPLSYYNQELYVNFIESPKSQDKVKQMALFKFKKNYPNTKPILYETDVWDAMNFVVNKDYFSQTHNLHNMIVDAAYRLYNTIVENVYAEDELYDQYINIGMRVHETTQAQSVASCKNKLKDKCYYTMGNIM